MTKSKTRKAVGTVIVILALLMLLFYLLKHTGDSNTGDTDGNTLKIKEADEVECTNMKASDGSDKMAPAIRDQIEDIILLSDECESTDHNGSEMLLRPGEVLNELLPAEYVDESEVQESCEVFVDFTAPLDRPSTDNIALKDIREPLKGEVMPGPNWRTCIYPLYGA